MTEPYYSDDRVTVHAGDCLDVLATLPDASVDAVVTDPPYGLEFMGKEWDSFKTYAGGNPNMKPQGTTAKGSALSFAPGSGPIASHGMRQKNPRCRRCGKLMRGNGSCKCPEPQPDTRTAEGANQFQFWCEDWAQECLRVLKPGGHMLAFGGTRTWHRLTCAIEDAGFEIRDSIAWLYGSGFPKSLDVSKAIDKRRDWAALAKLQTSVKAARVELGISQSEAARRAGIIEPHEKLGGGGFMWFETGMRIPTRDQYERIKSALGLNDECDRAFEEAEREIVSSKSTNRNGGSWAENAGTGMFRAGDRTVDVTAPATPEAVQWQGWGTALKPGHEPIVVARKPFPGTVAANVLAHGTGALNIDGCRIEGGPRPLIISKSEDSTGILGNGLNGSSHGGSTTSGRWPANVVLDDSQAAELDEQSGTLTSGKAAQGGHVRKAVSDEGIYGGGKGLWQEAGSAGELYGDQGGASRFFYTAKADSNERPRIDWVAHPTVKPLDLMRWLVRLVTPPGGKVLDPFAGSGTTGEAALLEGFLAILIERETDYLPLITQRIHRRLNPVEAIRQTGGDLGLFGEPT